MGRERGELGKKYGKKEEEAAPCVEDGQGKDHDGKRSGGLEDGGSIRRRIKDALMEDLNQCHQVGDEDLYAMIDKKILEYGQSCYLPLKEKIDLRVSLFDSFRRLGILQELLNDDRVTEIMVNGPEHIFIEKNGQMELWNRTFDSEEQLEDLIQQIVSRVNRIANVSHPIADARLEDGSRVHVVLPPISLEGPSMTIRKFPEPITLGRLIHLGAVSEEAVVFLKLLVEAGYNIFISGGTNSGKSTFLNALTACIPQTERVITIEDSAELQIQHVDNLVRLETREANSEGDGAVTIADLIRASLRMNPSRIIVGEVRGKEALDMISAMNTGHDGSLSTGHGNSPRDMVTRLETMVLMGADLPLPAIRSQIASALDIMVHLGRLRDRSRKVLEIVEVGAYEGGEIKINSLYTYEEEWGEKDGGDQEGKVQEGERPNNRPVEGYLKKVGELHNTKKLRTAGFLL